METVSCFKEEIYSGAEARVYKTLFLGVLSVCKERKSKDYRHPLLDKKLTISRLIGESRAMARCLRLGIDVPTVYFVSSLHRQIWMEYVKGISLKDFLDLYLISSKGIGYPVGYALAKLHNANIIHGDLTSSNLMIRSPFDFFDFKNHNEIINLLSLVESYHFSLSSNNISSINNNISESNYINSQSISSNISEFNIIKNQKLNISSPINICLIDLGLTFSSVMAEDKAVDLYVMERAIQSTHPHCSHVINEIFDGYKILNNTVKDVFKKLDEVRLRGRKRSMIG